MNKNKMFKEKFLEALDEELSSPEEYLTEMSKVGSDKSDGGMILLITIDKKRIGEPYFKIADNINYDKAKRIARISFLRPEYIIHKNTDGKINWFLNNKEKRQLVNFLERIADVSGRSYFKKAIIQYNNDKYDVDELETVKLDIKNYNEKELHNKKLPFNLPMPNYMKL